MNLLLLDVVAALLKEINLSNLRIVFKINSYSYDVTDLVSRDALQYTHSGRELVPIVNGHRPGEREFYTLKRGDPFQLIVLGMKLSTAKFSDKTTLTLLVEVR